MQSNGEISPDPAFPTVCAFWRLQNLFFMAIGTPDEAVALSTLPLPSKMLSEDVARDRARLRTRSAPPDDSCGESDGGGVVSRELVVACCDASEVLEAAEHALDEVSALIGFSIERARLFARGVVRDDGHGATVDQPLAQATRIVGTIGCTGPSPGDLREQDESSPKVAELAWRHLDGERSPERVAERVDLGGAATTGAADGLLFRPPFPPAAERWALAVVESIA